MISRLARPGLQAGEGEQPASLFHKLYMAVAGRHPELRPWHFQWLAGMPLYGVLRPLLGSLTGDVLDVGCGYKPYRRWIPGAARYFGIDVFPGPAVDAVIVPGEPWPVGDEEFDVVLCTQVLEHVGDLELTASELVRTVKPGGTVVISVPFIFGEHNSPHDYRRFSRYGIRRLIEDRLEIVDIEPHGAIGSTVGAIVLGWTYDAMPRRGPAALAVAPLLPLWLLLCLVTNMLGALLDRLDTTGLYYGNVLVHARKPAV
jgi:SAM-dependent methyltransferase